MSLIVEDGTGLSTAESYASVAEADDWNSKVQNTAWAGLDQATKEALLRKATLYIDGTYRAFFYGSPISASQGLVYPLYDPKAFPYGPPPTPVAIPVNLKRATAELAFIARTTPLAPQVTRGKKRVKVGSLEVEYDGNSPVATKFVSASLLLSGLLANGNRGSAAMVGLTRC